VVEGKGRAMVYERYLCILVHSIPILYVADYKRTFRISRRSRQKSEGSQSCKSPISLPNECKLSSALINLEYTC
jgi:hypothetical protein